ncbi:S-ribosylhomocysteine lyase [Thiospirochaeta perfilievii]|uniref:S-ribosylhomocysteine lyase n=1 Tax=Thiospirochaeta perfilievii TaxID=252967 RepID=A0A5C1Q7P0_9SPIO|nr:S-ribosylhomocysteine lyase [Thiospirochaeta perfilievii]QEN04045.1 S-ribosylhomocysteine lyase [Thiospirochaeta perfilievii]
MEKIPSFTVDHTKLLCGVYVSRQDRVGSEVVTTFDIRMKRPNMEPVIDVPALHTIEHLGATFLRNNTEWKDRVIYFGPMGCRTGNYLILKGDLKPMDIKPLLIELYSFMADYQGDIPGATAKDCGNYQSMDLNMGKYESKLFLEVLNSLNSQNTIYP